MVPSKREIHNCRQPRRAEDREAQHRSHIFQTAGAANVAGDDLAALIADPGPVVPYTEIAQGLSCLTPK